MGEMRGSGKSVLIIDDDRDVAELVQTILIDEGFRVSCLYEPESIGARAAIDRLEPDCVLLDGATSAGYGRSWELASWLTRRSTAVPVVMLSAHSSARDEAVLEETKRSRSAHFAGVVPKPFDIDQLVTAVCTAVGRPVATVTDEQERQDQSALFRALEAAGARELKSSRLGRLWVMFTAGPEDTVYKVYRWRAAGVYFVGRYKHGGVQLEPLGQFADLEALLAYCLTKVGPASKPTT